MGIKIKKKVANEEAPAMGIPKVKITKLSESELKLYRFGPQTDGNGSMKDILGGKGANLAEMAAMGLPVPPGFTIPCEASVTFKKLSGATTLTGLALFKKNLWEQIDTLVEDLQDQFGYMPLLSVRSGARVSMPGMMDTILNVGLTQDTLPFWKEKLGERAALDSYRRLIQMYASVAMGVPMEHFEAALEKEKEKAGVTSDSELDASQLERLVGSYHKILDSHDLTFPASLQEQISGAVMAVFRSWDNPRAKEYRKIHGYSDDWGTAVNIQSMVFGNLNDQSATGVVFTRCPSTGEYSMVGEFLVNAQGEDVVAGIRTPEPISKLWDWNKEVADKLEITLTKLETHYRDMQDVEFTVQDGKLYLLQTRNGKRSAKAAFRIARDMFYQGLITKQEAVGRVTQEQLLSVMQETIDPAFKTQAHLTGIAAGGGVVSGIAVFSSGDAVNCTEPCILVTKETDPDDIAGMAKAVGILTATGGLTSHAAVVARGMNKSCVVGATDLHIKGNQAYMDGANGKPFTYGDKITIDGATGRVWVGIDVPLIAGGQSPEVKEVVSWSLTDPDGISERLDYSRQYGLEQLIHSVEVVKHESLYVDTAMAEDASGINLTALKSSMTDLGSALAFFQGSEIVIDLSPMSSHLQKSDAAFDLMFGLGKDHDMVLAVTKAETMTATWSQEILDKVVVKLPEGAGNLSSILYKAGVKVMGSVSTVADLLASGGPVTISDSVIEKVFGGKAAYEAVRDMIEKSTGKKLSGTVKSPVYWYDFLNKVA